MNHAFEIPAQSRLEKGVVHGLIPLLIFSPLAFGAVHVWAYWLMEIWAFSLIFLWSADRLLIACSDNLKWIHSSVNLGWIAFCLLVFLQITPLPAGWVGLLSEKTFSSKSQIETILETTAKPGEWMILAHALHPALTEGLKLLVYVGIFFLVIHTVRSKKQINLLVWVLIGLGLFETLYGISQTFSHNPRIWWWKSRMGGARFASGTFVVSNHFAFYLEMICFLSAGFVLAQKRPDKRFLSGRGGLRAQVQRFVNWFAPESSRPRMVLLSFSTVIMATGLFLSASRGGILAAAFAMLMMAGLFWMKKGYRRWGGFALGLFLIALIYGLHIGMDPTLRKFEKEQGLYHRLLTSQSLLPMIRDYPVTGVGWGNFRFLYPRYCPREYDGVSSSGYAHNDWLEAGAETGLLGLGLIGFIYGLFLYRLIRLWLRRRNPHAVGIGAGVIAALFSVGFHSLFDFSLHIPANPLTLAVVAGLGYVALHRRHLPQGEDFFYPQARVKATWPRRLVLSTALLGGILLCMGLSTRHFMAELLCPTEWNSTLNLDRSPYLTDIEAAIEWNPWNSGYHFRRGKYYLSRKSASQGLRSRYTQKAIQSLGQAVQLNPAQGLYWYELGKGYTYRSEDSEQYLKTWLPKADRCFKLAVDNAPRDPVLLSQAASYWIWRSGMLTPLPARKAAISRSQKLFQKTLALRPGRWKWAAEHVWKYYPDDGILLDIAPPSDARIKRLLLQWMAEKKEKADSPKKPRAAPESMRACYDENRLDSGILLAVLRPVPGASGRHER